MRYGWMLLPVLIACAAEPQVSEWEGAQLEKAEVAFDPGEDVDPARRDLVGALRVQGEGSSWEIFVSTPVGTEEVGISSPTGADLSVLHELDGRVALGPELYLDEWAVGVLADDELHYFLEPAYDSALASELLGSGFASFGSEIGVSEVSDGTLRFFAVTFVTDDGPVEAYPGEPLEVVVDGATFRATVIAAYAKTLDDDATAPNCVPADELLSYELVRVDGEADLDPVSRADGAEMATAGCSEP